MKENIWSRRVFKKWAAINSKNYSYGRSKTLIKQRLIQTAPQALHHFGNQPLLRCLSEMNPPLNYQAVPRMVIAVVRKGRQKLRQKFESNKKMLKFDSKDGMMELDRKEKYRKRKYRIGKHRKEKCRKEKKQ
ncbi:unnamed protein product [Rotaria sp. Silwood2]|nr:unnamed protein product [Rotaria sp. Silwood2]CAF3422797.1 unnamed protein product [Rotaria sp. Silwood2]